MVPFSDDAREPEPATSAWDMATQLKLVDELTRLSRIHIDLASSLARLQEQQQTVRAELQEQQQKVGAVLQAQRESLRADLDHVARETTRNAEALFNRVALRVDAFEQERGGRGRLLADLTWYPTWSETAPVSGDPLISVVMPTRDRRELLQRALGSLRQQTYENWEAVVVDDASTDDTADLVRSLAAIDTRIKLIQSDGGGSAAARQRALLEANGQVLAYLDDDNLMGRGWLRAVAEFFGRNSAVDVAYGAQLRLDGDSNSACSQPFVLFEPYDEVRLAESNFIDMGVLAHRAGLAVQHPAGVRGVDDWHYILDLAELGAPWQLPVVASIYLTTSSDRESQRSDHHVSEELTRSRSAHRRLLDDRFVEAALRSTRAATSFEVGSPVPTMTRLDGEVLLFVLVALARRHARPLRVADWSADERAVSIVQFLTDAGLETNWLSFLSGPAKDGTPHTTGGATAEEFLSRSLTSVTLSCCSAADAGDLPDGEPACVRSITDLGVTFDAVLVESGLRCISAEVARSLVGPDGVVFVHTDGAAATPNFDGYASAARIGHQLWIASPNETDFARLVPVRGLIEGSRSPRT